MSSDLESAINQISQNSNNRKLVYQTVVQIIKNNLDKKTHTKELIESPKVLETLETLYSTRFIILCNETFSFLYQLCKLAIKSDSVELKAHISSLVPRLLVTYFYYTSHPEEKSSDIDGLEILFNEMTKLAQNEKMDYLEELDAVMHVFPELESITQNAVLNVYSKKIKSSLNLGSIVQEDRMAKILEIFISYVHFYPENAIEQFFLLADMVAGVKVNLKDMHLSSTSEYTKEFTLTSESSNKSKIIMKCISGVETIAALKPAHHARKDKCITNLALKSANLGQFRAYVYSEAKQLSQLDDVFS